MRTRTGLVSVAVLVASLASCGDDTADTTVNTSPPPVTTTIAPPATTTTAAPATTTAAPTTTTTTEAATGVQIEITVTADGIDGEDRYQVPVGEEVTITVVADLVEEVHVHGYDLSADIAPGSPGVITFIADIPGIFEVELEVSHQPLFELVVS